jgi:anti-sigma regulatory factor (Ser/Thr protein kinase)
VTVTGFVHQALLYRDPAEYLAGTVPFVRAGLAAGEPVLVAVPGAGLDRLCAALGDVAGQIRFADMAEEGRNPGRIIPWVLHAFLDRHAGTRVRIVGEPIWPGRSAAEYPACVQHEALINMAFAGRDATILCPYDAAGLSSAVLADASGTHPELVDPAGATGSPGYRPDAVVAAYNLPLPPVPAAAATLEFDAAAVALALEFVVGYASAAGLAERRTIDLRLAVGELVTNAVVHGTGRGALSVWQESGAVVAEVRSPGRAAGPLAGRVPPAPDEFGGRGLALVNYVADLVRVHTADSATTVRVYLRP